MDDQPNACRNEGQAARNRGLAGSVQHHQSLVNQNFESKLQTTKGGGCEYQGQPIIAGNRP